MKIQSVCFLIIGLLFGVVIMLLVELTEDDNEVGRYELYNGTYTVKSGLIAGVVPKTWDLSAVFKIDTATGAVSMYFEDKDDNGSSRRRFVDVSDEHCNIPPAKDNIAKPVEVRPD